MLKTIFNRNLLNTSNNISKNIIRKGGRGRGWYYKYINDPENFDQKYKKTSKFNWSSKNVSELFDGDAEKIAKWTASGIEMPSTGIDPSLRTKVFMEIEIDSKIEGKLIFELADDFLPVTCENFANLCAGRGAPLPKGIRGKTPIDYNLLDGEDGDDEEEIETKPELLTYKGTPIHKIIRDSVIIGGDVEFKTGEGSFSSFGFRYFEDEGFFISHSSAGILSMVNSGVNTNASQFYITLAPCEHLDGSSVAFGRIIEGMNILEKIANIYTANGKPTKSIIISDCGILKKNSDNNNNKQEEEEEK